MQLLYLLLFALIGLDEAGKMKVKRVKENKPEQQRAITDRKLQNAIVKRHNKLRGIVKPKAAKNTMVKMVSW